MKHFSKYLIICLLLLLSYSCNIAAGSYPYAEGYEIDTEEDVLIKAIDSFKKTYSTYIPPVETQLVDGRRDSSDHWHHVYFYYPDRDELINTWTRPADNGKTTFAFVAVNKGLTLGNWKRINQDFTGEENKEQKRLFEERILKEVEKLLPSTRQ